MVIHFLFYLLLVYFASGVGPGYPIAKVEGMLMFFAVYLSLLPVARQSFAITQ